jgi:hypothetical protein
MFLAVSSPDESRYPDFEFRSKSQYEAIYDNEAGEQIVEVFPAPYLTGEGVKRHFVIRTVAVLTDEDAPLYYMLQWKDAWRHHPVVAMAKCFMIVIAYVRLIVLHVIIVSLLGLLGHPIQPFILCFPLVLVAPILEILIALGITYYFRICAGIIRILFKLQRDKRWNGKDRAYYRDLFEKLAQAGHPDRAAAAKTMARISRLY